MLTPLARSLRRHFAPLCLVFAFLAFASVTRADDTPTFSAPEVNDFVRDYSAFVDQGVAIMKQYMEDAKANDTAKMQLDMTKVQQFQAQTGNLQAKGAALQGKLKPDETQKFTDYIQKEIKKLTDAMQGQ